MDWISLIASLASAIAAAIAVYVAYLSVKLSVKALETQDKHNRLSVKPIPFVALADYPHMLRVKIANYGSGPLIIKEVTVYDDSRRLPSLHKWMPPLPASLAWSNRTSAMAGRSIPPEHELILLELRGDVGDETFASYRDACRKTLSRLTIRCAYTDIYDQEYEPIERELRLYSQARQISTGDDFDFRR